MSHQLPYEFAKANNSLYVTMPLGKIEKPMSLDVSTNNSVPRSRSASVCKLSDILSAVKKNEGDKGELGKYIPKEFLETEKHSFQSPDCCHIV